MSFFNSIIKNVKEFYSEINGATLTGAIDVVVVEQEDGTFKSSPFHVRFGKMGVLKAKEKIVDLEINGIPVGINMKLDDTGAAFFVEELAEGEDEDCWFPGLATSPFPDQRPDWSQRRSGELKPTSLFQPGEQESLEEEQALASALPSETVVKQDDPEEEEEEEEETPEASVLGTPTEGEGRKGKLNRKKRRRRNQLRASRRGSKSNILQREIQTDNDIAGDDMFAMDDVNRDFALEDNSELPICKSPSRHLSASSTTGENHEVSALLEPLAAVFLEEPNDGLLLTRAVSVSADFHYLSGHRLPEVLDGMPFRPPSAPLTDYEAPNEQPDLNVWRWGELPGTEEAGAHVQAAQVQAAQVREPESKSDEEQQRTSWLGGMFRGSRSSQPRDMGGVYLDDIVNDPEKRAFYLQPSQGALEVSVGASDPLDLSHIPRSGVDVPRDDDCESGNGPSLPMSPQSNSGPTPPLFPSSSRPTEDLAVLVSRHLPDLAVSLCGGLADKSITPDQFSASLLTYTQFLENLRDSSPLLEDPRLVVRLHEKYVSWSAASPILFTLMFFKQPLPAESVNDILKSGLPVNLNMSAEEADREKGSNKKNSWFGSWFGGSNEQQGIKTEDTDIDIKVEPVEEEEALDDTLTVTIPTTPRKRLETETNSSDSDLGDKKRYRKSMRLTSDQLAGLNLQKGINEIEFSVTTAIQGTSRCICHIYLWHHTDKVVISDIDGTITRSDVLGQFLPMVSASDWAQSGVVQLFSKIRANGYHIMYLSARALGQASMTKGYLESLRQQDVCLPDGPVFLNPDSLYHAFKREVIDKNPEEFKIRCMKDIMSLFGDKNPFFAGYGNKPNDAYAYRALGIPISRIFTINPAGELKHELTQNFQTSYESQSLEVDYYFPCRSAAQQIRDILQANTRKQSIYFDVADFLPAQQAHHLRGQDGENLSDNEDNVTSKPFRLRSGTDISDMLSSAKHRRNLRRNLQRSGGVRKASEVELNIQAPISRFPSLDLEALTMEVLAGDGKKEDLVKDFQAFNEDSSEVDIAAEAEDEFLNVH